MNIFIESTGSLVSSYLVKAIQSAGYRCIGSDVHDDVAGKYLADDFVVVPGKDDPNLWDFLYEMVVVKKIDVVIPSFDETLLEWAKRKNEFKKLGVHVILSDEKVIEVFQDKYASYHFFDQANVSTPKTSLTYDYALVKPRFGRGGKGVLINPPADINMQGMISQELLEGVEYTIDVFCDLDSKPVYVVPRTRLAVTEGKSTGGQVVNHELIAEEVKKICHATKFIGPINLQCIESINGDVSFIEVNPRIAGGMALGFAATENWINLIVNHMVHGNKISEIAPVSYGMKMFRYYSELFVK